MPIYLREIKLKREIESQSPFPMSLPIVQNLQNLVFDAPVTFFVGENGSGKSTLVEAITRKCGIYIWQGILRPRYNASPYENDLYQTINIEWANGRRVNGSFFGSDIFNNFARILDEWLTMDPGLLEYFGGKSLMTQSHGQSLMAFFRSRLKIKGLYILDEPETALSPKSQLELLELLKEVGRSGQAQFIIATHSPILLACPGARILTFDDAPVRKIDYEDTNHYRIYKEFMADPKKYISS